MEAAQSAKGEANRQRVDITTRLFERARLYYEMCRHLKTLRSGAEIPATVAEGRAQLAAAAGMLGREQAVYAWNVNRIEPAAAYCGIPARGIGEGNKPWPINYLQMDPRLLHVTNDARWMLEDQRIARLARSITALLPGSASEEKALEYWHKVAAEYPILKPYVESERLTLLYRGASLANLLPNGSFELSSLPESPDAVQLLQDMRSFKIGWFDADHCEVPYVASQGWNALENRCPQRIQVVPDQAEKHAGQVALRVASSGVFGGVITNVSLPDSHARYRLSFWHKAPAGGKINYGFMFHQVRPLPYLNRTQPAAKEWARVEVEFPFNQNLARDEASVMSLWIGVADGSAQAPVWFDDVRLERLSSQGL